MLDAHVHLQPHGEKPPVDRGTIRRYVEAALENGVDGVVFTEHLFRFQEAYALLAGWWESDPDPHLRASVAAYWRDHVNLGLSEYVALIEEAKSAGLPVRLGMEMDWIPGRSDALRALLEPYAWDVVLGSVHWIGAFGFDIEDEPVEWERRSVDTVFAEYAQLIAELASSGLVDVLAHPDLPKLWGRRPVDARTFHAQLVAAAVRGGCALEINTNGLRKPVGELYPAAEVLRLARVAGVPITIGSDAHVADSVGRAFDQAVTAARAAGYDGYTRYAARQRSHAPFGE
jgi:histidinol-phosphatase (PHP family)